MKDILPLHLLDQLRALLKKSSQQLQQNINTTMVHTYWQVGRLIVEQEQQGSERAAYGKQVLKQLSNELTAEFGKGFDARNLRNMRSFYQTFPNWNAVRTNLSWTHYRSLIRIEIDLARQWYLSEAIIQNWSARSLDLQSLLKMKLNNIYHTRKTLRFS
jgi:hypothetical protein